MRLISLLPVSTLSDKLVMPIADDLGHVDLPPEAMPAQGPSLFSATPGNGAVADDESALHRLFRLG